MKVKVNKRETISSGRHIFAVVDHVPYGYQIWNIGKNMIDGYLPLCKVIPGTHSVEPDTLKAIKIEGAQKILAAIDAGEDTVEKMERYINRHNDAKSGTWEYQKVERMKEALPWMRQIRWVDQQKMNFVVNGDLQDNLVLGALAQAIVDYENGNLCEVQDLLMHIVYAIDEFDAAFHY